MNVGAGNDPFIVWGSKPEELQNKINSLNKGISSEKNIIKIIKHALNFSKEAKELKSIKRDVKKLQAAHAILEKYDENSSKSATQTCLAIAHKGSIADLVTHIGNQGELLEFYNRTKSSEAEEIKEVISALRTFLKARIKREKAELVTAEKQLKNAKANKAENETIIAQDKINKLKKLITSAEEYTKPSSDRVIKNLIAKKPYYLPK